MPRCPLHTDATAPALPELPPGWHYTEDLAWDDAPDAHRARRLILGVAIAVVVAAAIAAW